MGGMLSLTETAPLCVAIDGRALGSRWGGEETYLRALLAGLVVTAKPADCFPMWVRPGAPVPADVAECARMPVHELATSPGPWHYSVRLPRAITRSRYKVDAMCSTTHAPLHTSTRTTFIIGDLSPLHHPEWFPKHTVVRLRTLWRLHARAAAGVLVPSEFTRRDVISTLGVDESRVFVVPPHVVPPHVVPPHVVQPHGSAASLAPDAGADAQTADAQTDHDLTLRALGVRGPFLLYVGNLHARKNVPRLIEAFQRSRTRPGSPLAEHQLVVAGGAWFGASDERRVVEKAGTDAVLLLGRVHDPTRDLLLQRCTALAYVSLFEGFGLPPVEAMAAGRPVVVSRAAALPETCGDAALYVDPLDVDDIGAGLERIVSDDALRAELVRAGRIQAAGYNATRTGEQARVAFLRAAGR